MLDLAKLALYAGLGLVATVPLGCSSQRLSTARVGASEGAVRAAREVVPPWHPEASHHLRAAEGELRKARTLLREGETEKGEWALRRAQADAEVAIGLAREMNARRAAEEAKAKAPPESREVGGAR